MRLSTICATVCYVGAFSFIFFGEQITGQLVIGPLVGLLLAVAGYLFAMMRISE